VLQADTAMASVATMAKTGLFTGFSWMKQRFGTLERPGSSAMAIAEPRIVG
jgi:hypothetical protein